MIQTSVRTFRFICLINLTIIKDYYLGFAMKKTVKIRTMQKSESIKAGTIFSNHSKHSSDLVFMNND